ncbi:hypothetical protein [Methylomonas albis]|nr:hypothetical protein [Methylomonas albis]
MIFFIRYIQCHLAVALPHSPDNHGLLKKMLANLHQYFF